jgi:hypothetical protein
MANIILFTDVAPTVRFSASNTAYFKDYLTYPGGAYAIASHLRKLGYAVLVIPHCFSLSFAGVKQIIKTNSNGLLWVGMSTSLMATRSVDLQAYRLTWVQTEELTVSRESLKEYSPDSAADLVWSLHEIKVISEFLLEYNAPFVVGGSCVPMFNGNNRLIVTPNTYALSGNGERYAAEISKSIEALTQFISNQEYDDTEFKTAQYYWDATDQVTADDWVPLEIARGCAFNCAFCTYDKKSSFDTYKHPTELREYLVRIYDTYGITKYTILDDLYNDSKEKVRVMYDEVWSKLPFTPEWTSYLRLDMIWNDPDSAEFLLHSGCKAGSFGIETLHNVAGRLVGKGLGKERILETLTRLKNVWKDEIWIHALMIMGLPGEPEESLLNTVEWLQTTDLVNSHHANPLYLTAPSRSITGKNIDTISSIPEKFGITWLSNSSWTNQQGVSFNRAAEIAKLCDTGHINLSHFDYPEIRRLGISHNELMKIKHSSELDLLLAGKHTVVDTIIKEKVNNYLTLSM